MSWRRPIWLAGLAAAGRSFVEVVRAELEALQRDLSRSGRQLLVALALLGVAVVLVGWVLGLLATALIAYLESTDALTLWQATLVVAGGLLLVAIILVLWSRRIVLRIDPPTEMVRRRLADHFDWVEGQVRGPKERRGGSDEDEEHGG